MKRIAPGKKVISFRYTIMSLRTAKKKETAPFGADLFYFIDGSTVNIK